MVSWWTRKTVGTVAHAVDGFAEIRVTAPGLGLTAVGTPMGVDDKRDLALLRLSRPMPGHVFGLAPTLPAIGTEIAMQGFPLGNSLAQTIGHITALHDHRSVEGGRYDLSDVVVTDAAQNPGNSGGPWITRDGEVVALAESGPPYDPQNEDRAQGSNGGVSAAEARARFHDWRQVPDAPSPVACPEGSGSQTPAETQALATLTQYYSDINTGDYASAYAQHDPASFPLTGLDAFINGVKTSHVQAVDGSPYDVDAITSDGNTVTADVRTRSLQDPASNPEGQSCSDWSLRYRFVQRYGVWLIQSATFTAGTNGPTACSSAETTPIIGD